MCGEMAGDVRYTRLLLALGLRSFSMPANALLEVKRAVNLSDLSQLQRTARKIMNNADTLKQRNLLAKLNAGLEVLES